MHARWARVRLTIAVGSRACALVQKAHPWYDIIGTRMCALYSRASDEYMELLRTYVVRGEFPTERLCVGEFWPSAPRTRARWNATWRKSNQNGLGRIHAAKGVNFRQDAKIHSGDHALVDAERDLDPPCTGRSRPRRSSRWGTDSPANRLRMRRWFRTSSLRARASRRDLGRRPREFWRRSIPRHLVCPVGKPRRLPMRSAYSH